jgi:MFS family permease
MPRARDPAISRLMLFFAVVYAVEGIGQAKVGVIWQPLVHYLKQAQGWTPLEVAASLAVLDIPWVIKPLYGLVSDFLPLFGYRRRSYLMISSLAAAAAYYWTGQAAAPSAIIVALVVTSVAMAASSTLCGALLVENGQRHNASAAFVNQQWIWFNVAVMAATLLGGWLTEAMTPSGALHAAAWIAALTPIAVLAGLPLVQENASGSRREDLRNSTAGFAAALRSRTLWLIAAFLFCYYFSPGFGTPLYYYMTDRLRFSQTLIGALSSVTALGWIAGGVLFRFALSGMEVRALLRLSIVFGTATTLLYLALRDPASAVIVYFLAGAAAMVANIATLTLAAEHCPKGAEGFTFAALMSVINLASPVSDTTGAFLYEHLFNHRLAPLILVSAVSTAFVLVLLKLVDLARRPAAPGVAAGMPPG